MSIKSFFHSWCLCRNLLFGLLFALFLPQAHADIDISNLPLFLGGNGTPLALLIMGRDHKLYYEAYNDASDLNQDGEIDVGYKPNLTQDNQPLNYFGYFDSYKCYRYSSGLFIPTSVTTSKKCSGNWSGDFLNYLTTSRIDALRRVLYGGYRSTDSSSTTILERARIPQDAHSWGKEYASIAYDGYDIRHYTPLSLPDPGTRHLFANTTLQNDTTQTPLLRVLTNSSYRIWEWVAIERPVAGDRCLRGGNGPLCTSSGGVDTSHPADHAGFTTLLLRFENSNHLMGMGVPSNGRIQCNSACNPYGDDDYYITVIKGILNVTTAGTYEFSADGDDAIEVIIDGMIVTGYYGGHGVCGSSSGCREGHKGSITLSAGTHIIEFHHEEVTGGDSYYLYWKGADSLDTWQIVPSTKFSDLTISTYDRIVSGSTRTDYTVRVQACVAGLLESECKGYPENNPTVYKPTGLLHDYGETDRMAFGLLTGSFSKQLSGGVLRKNVSSFSNEIDASTGQFIVPSGTGSIVDTISKIRIVGFQGDYYYNDGGCGVPMTTAMREGRCAMWGNPIAEMMYEGLRYFGGKSGPTSAYGVTSTTTEFNRFVTADKLGLPLPSWNDPYRDEDDGGYPYCSKPFELVIADAPSFDTDQLPGVDANFGSGLSSDIGGLNVASIGQLIWNNEYSSGSKNIFIGQSGNSYDTAPTPKSVSSFSNIRGLAPEEPTREGGYYAASVSYFGKTTGVRQVDTGTSTYNVRTDTFGVALSSPLPTIDIPMADGKKITIVPFAKSVGGSGINATKGMFQPTNTIVDFFVETIANTGTGNADLSVNDGRPYIKFRINYEDSEYGSDHDMDAIVTYTFSVDASNQLIVNLSSDYAAGGIIQHMGYVISGTTADGVYLEVRDVDTGASADPDYFLDTPPGVIPPASTSEWDDNSALPLNATRTFTPSTAAAGTAAAFIKHDPLWYASKWGGFTDSNANALPDQTGEWDQDNDGDPDNYFLVTNAGKLKEQLSDTFEEISRRTSAAAAVSVNSSSLITGSRIYQARFNSGDWTGELRALALNATTGAVESTVWRAQDELSAQNFNTGREILTTKPSTGGGIPFRWPTTIPSSGETDTTAIDKAQIAALNGSDGQGEARLEYLRGDDSNEDPQGNQYRKRTIGANRNILGDIVNSNPFYVGYPRDGYPFGDYQSFSNTHLSRSPMIYVGANDGMLHGFDAETGAEIFAYVPSMVFDKLNALTQLSYVNQHQFYVDGSPTVRDVQFSDGSWHTVLVGGLRAGGVGYFALDVTDPTVLTETNAANVVLWEFKDIDLGLTFSQPSLVRLKDSDSNPDNNRWAAVFGNGYNSNNPGKMPITTAVLYVANVETGQIIRKIDLGEGLGLSTPSAVDVDADDIADFIYAGDLEGNLWRFDIRDPNPNSWTATKLFTAQDAGGNPQPITSAPQVTRQLASATNLNTSLMVLFGTGRYLGASDVISTTQQTFYGIWDDVDGSECPAGSITACFARTNLQAQIYCPGNPVDPTCQVEIDASTTVTSTGTISSNGNTYNTTSARCVEYGALASFKLCGDPARPQQRGWYLDLKQGGERVVGDSLILGSNIEFVSIIPNDDPCAFGGNSRLNVLSAVDGQRPPQSFVGVSESGTNFAASSVDLSGIASSSTAVRDYENQEVSLYQSKSGDNDGDNGSNGNNGGTGDETLDKQDLVDLSIGRQSWRQLDLQ